MSYRHTRISIGRGGFQIGAQGESRGLLVKHLVDERHGDGSLADGGGDALDVAAAHVADRKDSGTARFEQVGRPVQRPPRGCQVVAARDPGRS